MVKKIYFFSATLWSALVIAGFLYLYDYMNKPGEPGSPPELLPKSVQAYQIDLPTLYFFAHPKCPCTRAGLAELSKLMSKIQGKANVNVIFTHPIGKSIEWVKSDLWEKANEISGVNIYIDSQNKFISIFKPKTSGQTYLYSNIDNRPLIYSGGITSSRGHEGDNTGSDSIANWIYKKKKFKSKFSVFGCSLFHNKDHG